MRSSWGGLFPGTNSPCWGGDETLLCLHQPKLLSSMDRINRFASSTSHPAHVISSKMFSIKSFIELFHSTKTSGVQVFFVPFIKNANLNSSKTVFHIKATFFFNAISIFFLLLAIRIVFLSWHAKTMWEERVRGSSFVRARRSTFLMLFSWHVFVGQQNTSGKS